MRRRFTLAALALAAFLGFAAPALAAYDDDQNWTPPSSVVEQTDHWDWGS